VERLDGRVDELPSCGKADLAAGEAIVVMTPGGGGYGAPDD
jgi:5-oxoprolinase (ATP-hydrolysing)